MSFRQLTLARVADVVTIVSAPIIVITVYLWIKGGQIRVNWAFIVFVALVIVMVASSIMHRVASRRMRTGIEFWPTREDTAGLPALFKDNRIEEIWAMSPTATNIRGQNCHKILNRHGRRKLQRVILLSPSGEALAGFARVEKDRRKAKDELINEIRSTSKAFDGQVQVKYLDAPFNGTIIANPQSGEYGWIQFEFFYPWSSSEKRSIVRIDRASHPERFKEVVEAYMKVWDDLATEAPQSLTRANATFDEAQESHRVTSALEVRPVKGPAIEFIETAHNTRHHRMEIYNHGPLTAKNVQVKLKAIDPLPNSEYFRARADFPQWVRPAHLAEGKIDTGISHDINPGTGMMFELLFYWESTDGRIFVNGLNTKMEHTKDACFEFQDHEVWRLEYEISSSSSPAVHPQFVVRRDGKTVAMNRLT